MKRLCIFLVVAIWPCLALAGFFSGGITSTGNCPKGTAYADGCAAAVTTATYIKPAFFTTARQSGQSYGTNNANRPPWNVAGVDYAVGPTSAIASLTDIASVGSSIPGCAYNSLYSSYGPALVCASTASPTIQGYDFGPNQAFKTGSGPVAAHDCVMLVINNTVTGTVTIKNNNFSAGWSGASVGSTCAGGATTWTGSYPLGASYPNSTVGGLNPLIWFANSSQADADIEYNQFDGNYLSTCCTAPTVGKSGITAISYASTATHTITVKYNVFLNLQGHSLVGVSSGTPLSDYIVAFNYIEGWESRLPSGHGEAISISGPYDSFTGSFNTVFATSDMCFCSTGVFWLQSSSGAVNAMTLDHNTIASNNPGGASSSVVGTVSGTIDDGAGGPGNIFTVTAASNPSLIAVGDNIIGAALGSSTQVVIYAKVSGSGVGSKWLVECGGGSAPSTTNPCPNADGANVTYKGPNASTLGVMNGTGYGLPVTVTNATIKGGYANAAAAQFGHGTIGAITLTSNYVDPTGGYGSVAWVVSTSSAAMTCAVPAVFTGNVNLTTGDGTGVNAWSASSGTTGC